MMFQFALCQELGVKHPNYLKRSLSAKELLEWQYVYNKRPFGSDLGFYQAAIVACMIANTNLRKGKKPFTPADFIPKFGEMKKEPWEEIMTQLTSMSTKHIKRKKTKNGKHRKYNC